MPGLLMADPTAAVPKRPAFSVASQNVVLDIDFASRTIKGKAEITIIPRAKDLRHIPLNCRQTNITHVTVDNKLANYVYQDPYDRLVLSSSSTVQSHQRLQQKIAGALRFPPEPDLVVQIPWDIQIQELDPASDAAQELMMAKSSWGTKANDEEATANLEAPVLHAAVGNETMLTPLKVVIEFVTEEPRDGFQFVGLREDDPRYPHVYTRNTEFVGSASCLFPCVDDLTSRCPWSISIRCPRTIGDAFKSSSIPSADSHMTNGVDSDGCGSMFNDAERALDLAVVCSGDMTDEIVDPIDPSRKTCSFQCKSRIAARHIGFAIGPFEVVNLAKFRESDDDVNLGDQAIRLHGFGLPERSSEVEFTCMMMANAADFLSKKFTTYPFTSYKMCFVDDLTSDVVHTAGLSICSSRLLYSSQYIDPQDHITRTLIHALATQWCGISIVPRERTDTWIIVGCAYFMTDWYLQELMGKNDFRYRLKLAKDRVCELDLERPSIYALGEHLALDPTEMEFLKLKATVVLFILHFRLFKQSGRIGVDRVIYRMLYNNKMEDLATGAISTNDFLRTCEKVGHAKLDAFFKQWVHGAGCPTFHVQQKYNKKKFSIEMTIMQIQARSVEQDALANVKILDPENFRREVIEDTHEVYAGEVQRLFTGPMTIQVHEADGTPYEHIIDIKEGITKFEIPYNTKYKRLKRSRRQKERAAAAQGLDLSGEAQDDVLTYCLGDVLQSDQEVQEWQLVDWDKDTENQMAQENFEWIRIDKDFEWMATIKFVQPHYMWVSQLQQDTDVVAQVEAMQYLAGQKPFPIISTIAVRTLMDQRYFWGIRVMATDVLANCANDDPSLNWIGLHHLTKAFKELYCEPDSDVPKENDFSDTVSYYIQCAIPKALAKLRLQNGKAPDRVKEFFIDKLASNENGNNEFSDCHYVAMLMECLAQCLAAGAGAQSRTMHMAFDFEDEEMENDDDNDIYEKELQKRGMDEITRTAEMDTWTPSYRNQLTVTYLECQKIFMQAKLIEREPLKFVLYTREDNSDEVRIKAFACLIQLRMFLEPGVLRRLFYVFANESSPYVRDEIWQLIWQGLGQVAIGMLKEDKQATQPHMDGLIIEGGGETAESRAKDIARTTTIEGALAALKIDLKDNERVVQGLERGLRSQELGLQEFADVITVCSLLFEPVNGLMFKIQYPKDLWKVEHLGNAKMKFTKLDKFRDHYVQHASTFTDEQWAEIRATAKAKSKPAPAVAQLPPPTSPAASRAQSPTLKRKNSVISQSAPAPPPQPTPAAPPTLTLNTSTTHTSEPPRKKRKSATDVTIRLPREKLAGFPAGESFPRPEKPSKAAHSSSRPSATPATAPPVRAPPVVVKKEAPPAPAVSAMPTPTSGAAPKPMKIKLKIKPAINGA